VLTTSGWMWRVDLHHHRQVYETWAPLFVLRHRRWKTHGGPSKLAADLRLERSASGLTVRFPHPVGLSAKKRFGAECGNQTRVICLEGERPKATRPTPLTWRALCLALRLPVSMRRIVACAGLWGGGFRVV
jgi:hypothetical protein